MIAPIKLHLLMFMHINQIGISAYTIKIPAVIKHCCLWADMKNYASSSFESIEQCFSWLFFLWKLFNYQQLSTINNWLFFFITSISIYKFGLAVWVSVCLFVCLYTINVKTAEPIGPKFFVGHHVTTGKVYERSKFQIFVSIKIRSSLNFWKFWKSTKLFVKIRNI